MPAPDPGQQLHALEALPVDVHRRHELAEPTKPAKILPALLHPDEAREIVMLADDHRRLRRRPTPQSASLLAGSKDARA